jgi:RNA-directed DNA polymerase
MSRELALPISFIEGIARGASFEYFKFTIPKRNTTDRRTIYHPSRRLKALQRWFLRNVIEALPVHPAAMAYRKDISTWNNASRHAGSSYLLRMDFENFFECITIGDLQMYMRNRTHLFTGWTVDDVETFSQVICRNGVLTIGAPTSPGISNAICFDFDRMIEDYCQREDIVYSRYADDIFFSTHRPDVLNALEKEVPEILASLVCPSNIRLNLTKTRHSSKRGTRRVTGLTLGSDGNVYVGRPIKRKVRAQIHQLANLSDSEKIALAGLLAYVVGYDPGFINSLITKYGHERVRRAQNPLGP